ncbi:MAG: hypothetical protein Kow00108_02890 [Calditrichia bacterium]
MLTEMFNFQGKMSKLVPPEHIEAYQNVYLHLQRLASQGKLPRHDDYLGGNELAQNIYERKYFVKDLDGELLEKRPEDLFIRIASFVAAVEPTKEKQLEWGEKFYRALYDGQFMPGGRVLAGAGDLYRLKTLSNCFVTLIDEDNIESIYKSAYECARTYSYGGGIGVDISCLRPKDSVVHNAADKSTGAVSFMDIFSLTTGIIGQSGRRGALMITIDVKHPDSMEFIRVKKIPNWVTNQIVEQLKWTNQFSDVQIREIEKQVMENTQVRFANISLKVSDEFMQAVDEQSKYGSGKVLVYKKKDKTLVSSAYQTEQLNYSYGIPSKNIDDYELLEVCDDITALNNYLYSDYKILLSENDLNDAGKRDVFGDYVIQLENVNYDLAIRYAGDFLLYFASKPSNEIKRLVKAREIWDAFIEGNYKTAEPGLIFWSKMSKYSPSNYVGRPISSTNPCAEVPLEKGGACNLASVNLSRFVKNGYTPQPKIEYNKLKEAVQVIIRFLDNVVTWNEFLNPLDTQKEAARLTRRLGLGIMGIADMLNQLGVAYDSEEGIQIMETVMREIANASYQASAKLAHEKAPSEIFDYKAYSKNPFFNEALSKETQKMIKEYGLRNIAMVSIAPTGTISNIVKSFELDGRNYIGVSGGIEPIFALYYTRRSESFNNQLFKVFHSTVQAYIDMYKLNDKVNDISDMEELKEILPPYFFRTAHYIRPEKRVKIQSICQRYVDHSISSTVNLPEDIEPEVISDIYLKAWKEGLKGITIYRDGSRFPVLSVEGKQTEFQVFKERKFKISTGEDKEEIVSGDEIIALPDGRLTTVYHYVKFHQDKLENESENKSIKVSIN